MPDTTIDRMANDLGIRQFTKETLLQYKCRVIYSAMASWIKAISMDQPPGSIEAGYYGVSRRHLYERSRSIFEMICKMYPEINDWFFSSDIHPMKILRTRLINHGDLVNEGFDTNVALPVYQTQRLSSEIESVYGSIIGEKIHYSGIAALSITKADFNNKIGETSQEWFAKYIKDAWWTTYAQIISGMQYFNPFSKATNNNTAWQHEMVDAVEGIVLARTVINNTSHEYYLLKTHEGLFHKIDPFLQERGYHIHIMLALRSKVNNMLSAIAEKYADHVRLRLTVNIPTKENCLLESYSWPMRHINDHLFWCMEKYIWEYIKPQIDALGIRIMEENHG